MRLRVELRGVCAVVLDGIDVRECFHTKLAIETPAEGIENLVLFLCAMPDCVNNQLGTWRERDRLGRSGLLLTIPLMHIADFCV